MIQLISLCVYTDDPKCRGVGFHYGTEDRVKKRLLLIMTLKGNIQKCSELEGKKNKSYIFNSQYITSSLRTHLILWESEKSGDVGRRTFQ